MSGCSLQDISTFSSISYPYTTLSWNYFSLPAVAIFSTSWNSNTGQPHSHLLPQPTNPSNNVSDQRMIHPLTPSKSNISSLPACSFPCSSTTSSPLRKFPGHFRSGWRQSLSSLNCSCSNVQGKQRRSRRTTWLRWACTGLFTSPTGYTGMSFTSWHLCQYLPLIHVSPE